MKIRLLFCACLLSLIPCAATVDPAEKQILITAAQQADIFSSDAAPFELDIHFRADAQVPMDGTMVTKWAAKDLFYRKITVGKYEETDIRSGEQSAISRNSPFTPERVLELIGLLDVVGNPDSLSIKKVKRHRVHGIEAKCFETADTRAQGEKPHTICVDVVTNDVISSDSEEIPDQSWHAEFSDYAEFRGHRYPHKIKLFVDESEIIDATITRLETAPFAEGLLTIPPGAIVRRMCKGIQIPMRLNTPEPAFPGLPDQKSISGDTTVSMTVLPDGSVENVRVVGTSTRELDDAVLRTLTGWRFKPAMCGSEAVAYDIRVIVSFRRH